MAFYSTLHAVWIVERDYIEKRKENGFLLNLCVSCLPLIHKHAINVPVFEKR
jgi:hypothetical protein